MTRNFRMTASVALLALALSACGGGGGGDSGHVNSTPTPTPTPPPTPASASVTIFQTPLPQTYVSVGTSADHAVGSVSLGPVSSSDADQPHIRYTSAGYYEIQMPGAAYDKLVTLKGFVPQYPDTNNQFQPASTAQNQAFFFTSNSRLSGYLYSEIANWSNQTGSGVVAFGTATLPGQMPLTGSASYQGIVSGSSDVVSSNSFDGDYRVAVAGSVDLNFNFGQGTLAGAIALTLRDYSSAPMGTFAFKDTVFSVGSPSYSGAFASNASGQNFFTGRFTGPNAEETIGAWALPFIFNTGSGTLIPDNKTHQAFGAWIAKKGP